MDDSSLKSSSDVLDSDVESGFDIREYWIVLLEKAWLIVLCLLAGLFAGLSYVKNLPVTYSAQAVLQLGVENRNPLGIDQGEDTQMIGQELYQTVIASLSSHGFLRRVVEANNLHTDPRFMTAKPDGQAQSPDEAAHFFSLIMEAKLRQGTRLIDVTVNHGDPVMAQKLADSITTEFLKQGSEARIANSKSAVDYLKHEAGLQKNKLQMSEQKLQEYKEDNDAMSLDEKQDTVVSKLRILSNQLADTRASRMRLETENSEIKAQAGSVEKLLAIVSVANSGSVSNLRTQITEIEAKIAQLALRYTEKHPRMIQERTLLADVKASLKEEVLNVPHLISSELERAVSTERSFENAVKDQEKLALELNRQAIPYNVLVRDVETDRALYESILKRLKEADIAKGIEANSVRVFEPATLPGSPMNAKKAQIVAMAVAGGLALGILISVGLHLLDSSLRSVEQAERVTGLPVVGAIPNRPKFDFARAGAVLVEEPDSIIAEAIRSLRTSLYLAGRKPGRKTCLFTSALSSEGKTFSAINYSVSLAQQGLATLLVDADLRAPMVGKILSLKETAPGLADYLGGEAIVEQIISETDIPNLFVIGAGHAISSPAELLANRAFGDLLTEVGARFDHIVIDTAPVIPVSDTLLLIEHAQTVCVVARACKTPRKLILRAIQLLVHAGGKPVGLILNQIPSGRAFGYPYKYGGYKKVGYAREAAAVH
jgi:capsular exopolysaccharide synthesis family protein